jgi:hypothetical protein
MSLNFNAPNVFPDLNGFEIFNKKEEVRPPKIKDRQPPKTKISSISLKN